MTRTPLSRHARQRGQMAPIFALFLAVLVGFASLALDTNWARAVQATDRIATDAAGYAAAKAWGQEVSSYGYTATTLPSSTAANDGAVTAAQQYAALNGVSTVTTRSCNASTGSQIDVVFYDIAPAAGCVTSASPPAGYHRRVEIMIPPANAADDCRPTFYCVQVAATTVVPNALGVAGGGTTTTTTHASVVGTRSAELVGWGGCTGTAGSPSGCGDGSTNTDRAAPVRTRGVTSVRQVASGGYFSAALKTDGTVWTWGRNDCGQLGVGSTTSQALPVQVVGVGGSGTLQHIKAISAGWCFALALADDGTVYGWGDNSQGELGNGSTAAVVSAPVQVSTAQRFVSVATGYWHSLGLTADGRVYAWGNDSEGEVGNGGATSDTSVPTQVCQMGCAGSGMGRAISIAAAEYNSIALQSDGTVWTWGDNSNGQIGDGSTGTLLRASPVQVKSCGSGACPLTEIKALGLGLSGNHVLALDSSGQVWAWGRGVDDQLGNGASNRYYAAKVLNGGSPLTGIKAVGGSHRASFALRDDGTMLAWGSNANLGLGINSANPAQMVLAPTVVSDGADGNTLSGVMSFSSGGYRANVVFAPSNSHAPTSPVVVGWHENPRGEIGNGTTTYAAHPVAGALGLDSVIQISDGDHFATALTADGRVWSWGTNSDGVVGDGTFNDSTVPQVVNSPSGSGQLSGIIALASGQDFQYALASDGTVYAWGNNDYGYLGDGTFTTRTSPVHVQGVFGGNATRMKQISATQNAVVALADNGSAWTWGNMGWGSTATKFAQQGNCFAPFTTACDATKAFPVTDPSGSGAFYHIRQVATGTWMTSYLLDDGTTYNAGADGPSGWYNFSGEICTSSSPTGYGPLTPTGPNNSPLYNLPTRTMVSTPVATISDGYNASYDLMVDGTILGCGANGFGQLASNGKPTGGYSFWPFPVAVQTASGATFTHVVSLAGTFNAACSILSDGTVWCWGVTQGVGADLPLGGAVVNPIQTLAVGGGVNTGLRGVIQLSGNSQVGFLALHIPEGPVLQR